jgi:hypothetical protein
MATWNQGGNINLADTAVLQSLARRPVTQQWPGNFQTPILGPGESWETRREAIKADINVLRRNAARLGFRDLLQQFQLKTYQLLQYDFYARWFATNDVTQRRVIWGTHLNRIDEAEGRFRQAIEWNDNVIVQFFTSLGQDINSSQTLAANAFEHLGEDAAEVVGDIGKGLEDFGKGVENVFFYAAVGIGGLLALYILSNSNKSKS